MAQDHLDANDAASGEGEEQTETTPGDSDVRERSGPSSFDGVTSFIGMRWRDAETVTLEIRPELMNRGGLLSGVVTYALVDYCMGSTLWVQTSKQEHIATMNISINYIQTATSGEIVCRSTLDRRNRSSAMLRSEIRHEDGRLMVTAVGSYAIFPAPRTARHDPRRALTPTALTIAGSDSGGGAGIQADLKAFARCGVHGTSAITAITAQNTREVVAIHAIPPQMVLQQVRAVLADIRVDAVKVGMLGTAEVTHAVAQALEELPTGTPVVVDPVMIAESGARLLATDAQRALTEEILPRASVLTPNLPEARVLAGQEGTERGGLRGDEEEQQEAQALLRALLTLGPQSVVLTGGHRARAVDLFLAAKDGAAIVAIDGPRHEDGAAHGSGCTHSSILAAQLALGHTPLQAARTARLLAGQAVAHGLRDVGAGSGPVDVLDLAWLGAK